MRYFAFLLSVIFFLSIASCVQLPEHQSTAGNTLLATATPIIKFHIEVTSTIRSHIQTQGSIEIIETQTRSDVLVESENDFKRSQSTPKSEFLLCSPLGNEDINQLWEIVSDPYNPPLPGRDDRHHGVDFSYYRRDGRLGIEGEEIHSILPGIVAAAVHDRLPYGNFAIIETPGNDLPEEVRAAMNIERDESLYHLYAHLKDVPLVSLLDKVKCGDKLGTVGSTGYNIVNAHLHLETRIGPQEINFTSMAFYDTGASQLEMDTYQRWRTGGEFIHFDPMSLFQLFLDNQN